MSREELLKSLELLGSEISRMKGADHEVKERLELLVSDIESQLDDSEDEAHRAGLLDRIPAFIDQFEAEHPRVTAILNDIMVALGNLGI